MKIWTTRKVIKTIWPPYGSWSHFFNKVPRGYLGYRIFNFIYEILNGHRYVLPILIEGKYCVYYLPCGKNEKMYEVEVDGPNAKITLRQLLKRKWIKY